MRKQKHLDLLEAIKAAYPTESDSLTEDPYKTLFISNLDYSITTENLETTFKVYGDLANVVIVKDKNGKPKGYAFVQFARSKSLELAVKEAKGLKLGQRRITVDVERGRTVKGWLPKKCGGGLGKKREGNIPGSRAPRPGRDSGRDYNSRDRDYPPRSSNSRDYPSRDAPRDYPSRDSRRDMPPRDRFPPRDLRADIDRSRDRGSSRGDRGTDRPDRGMDRGGSRQERPVSGGYRGGERGTERGGPERGGPDRGGPDRGADRGFDRGGDRTERSERGGDRAERSGPGGRGGFGGDRDRDRGGYERSRYDR